MDNGVIKGKKDMAESAVSRKSGMTYARDKRESPKLLGSRPRAATSTLGLAKKTGLKSASTKSTGRLF